MVGWLQLVELQRGSPKNFELEDEVLILRGCFAILSPVVRDPELCRDSKKLFRSGKAPKPPSPPKAPV